MSDYKDAYLSLFRATEKAINLLIEAQREAEERIISEEDTKIILLPQAPVNEKQH